MIHERDTVPLEHELRNLEDNLRRVDQERLNVREQLNIVQQRFDDVYYRHEGNVRAQTAVFKRSKIKHSAKVMC